MLVLGPPRKAFDSALLSRTAGLARSRHVFRSRPGVVVVIALLALSGLLAEVPAAVGSSSSTISMGVVQSPVISALNYLNPAENYYVVSELYLPFAAYAFPPAPSLEPILAAGWSSNSNYTQWVLNLKSGLKWDDGSPLNATDLWYTITLENLTSGFSFAGETTAIKILNATAVEVDTNAPVANLVYLYCQQTNSYILPYKSYKDVPTSPISDLYNFTNFQNIVASGPFVIKDYSQGENPIVFTANPYYYKGPPAMKELDLYNYASLSSELAAYRAGTTDALWAYGASTIVTPLFQNVTGQQLFEIVPGAEMGIYFNMDQYPFNLTQVRQALAYSTNRTALNAAVNPPANQALPDYDNLIPSLESQVGLSGASVPAYTYNLTKAGDLLSSVGFKKMNGIWSYPNGTAFAITIITSDQGYGEVATTQVLNSQWKNAGFDVSVDLLSFTSYLTTEEGTTGWQVAVEIDNPGYYPSALGNLLGMITGSGDYGGAMDSSFPVSNGLPNYNYTAINDLLQQAQEYPLGSVQSNHYVVEAAPLVGSTVPIIPLFIIYNYQSVSSSYYWGSQSNNSGIFDRQALMQPQLWYDALWTVKPVTATTSTTSGVPTASSSTSPASSTSPSGNGIVTYAIIGIVVIVVVVVLALLALRRAPKPSPAQNSG
jgi:peptide/nickel transport system substrate-binding protein